MSSTISPNGIFIQKPINRFRQPSGWMELVTYNSMQSRGREDTAVHCIIHPSARKKCRINFNWKVQKNVKTELKCSIRWFCVPSEFFIKFSIRQHRFDVHLAHSEDIHWAYQNHIRWPISSSVCCTGSCTRSPSRETVQLCLNLLLNMVQDKPN